MSERTEHPSAQWPLLVGALLSAVTAVAVGVVLVRVAPDSATDAAVLVGALVVSSAWGLVLIWRARRRATDAERGLRDADGLARRQAALRRVATLVAHGAEPAEVYAVVVSEVAAVLGVDQVTLTRRTGDRYDVLATTGEPSSPDDDGVTARVYGTGRPARIDGGDGEPQSGVGAPVVVGGTTRGALVVGAAGPDPLPAETEDRVAEFADLVGTAIANADTRAESYATRARIIAAGDRTRHGIERDLRDGPQQRIASLGLGLRTLEASVPSEQAPLRNQVDNLVTGMGDLYTELQDLSRRIHPAILSADGLGPALNALIRRSVVRTTLEIAVPGRLPEPIEVAAYHVVAEALVNVAEHANATKVVVRASLADAQLTLTVTDDGVGGATIGDGDGLIGLRDRVEALSGALAVTSRTGVGTTVTARIPVPE